MKQISQDFAIGTLFAGAVVTAAIGLTQFLNFHQFPGLNQTRSIVMMASGGAAIIASTILSIYLCGQKE